MEKKELEKILELHKKWLEGSSNGARANLRYANISNANLSNADIDYSCWPLWCGSRGVKVDIKIVRQLLAHVACLKCNSKEFREIKKAITPYAKKSHRAKDLGLIK